MKIHVLYGRRRRNFYRRALFRFTKNAFYPAVYAARELADLGVSVEFFDKPTDRFFDCDTIVVTSHQMNHNLRIGWFDREERVAFIQSLRGRGPRVVYYDQRPSAGTTQFEVLPHVDLYCKQALFKDRSLYLRQLYGQREYTEYFHREFGIEDESAGEVVLPDPAELASKVVLGWGIAVRYKRVMTGRFDEPWNVIREALVRTPEGAPSVRHFSPDSPRRNNLAALLTLGRYKRATITEQRRRAIEQVKSIQDEGVIAGRVPKDEYGRTLVDSKMVLSCFGWGQICYREHEAWQTGGALLMPDMSNLDTWPLLYHPNETYIPLRWDVSDLPEAYWKLRRDDELRRHIAHEGQRRFLASFARPGREAAARRIKAIGEARNPDA